MLLHTEATTLAMLTWKTFAQQTSYISDAKYGTRFAFLAGF